MKLAEFDGFADESRVWVFGARRVLAEDETESLLRAVDGFLASWRAHGTPLRAARAWRRDRFLIVCADTATAPPSGCSIDALTGVLRDAEARGGVGFLGNEAVWYRDPAGRVRRATRPEFRSMATAGRITPETVVFDNSLTTLGEMRAGRWEGPAADRWHAVFFRGARSAGGG